MNNSKKKTTDFIKFIKGLSETKQIGVLIMLNGLDMLRNKEKGSN